MVRKNKDGKLEVIGLTISKKLLPDMNRKQRRTHLNAPRYSHVQKKVNELRKGLRPFVKTERPPKGKALTGYYSQLLSVSRDILMEA